MDGLADLLQKMERPATPPLHRGTANDILRQTYAEFKLFHSPHRRASQVALAGLEVEQRLEQRAQAERDDYFMTHAADRLCVGLSNEPAVCPAIVWTSKEVYAFDYCCPVQATRGRRQMCFLRPRQRQAVAE